MHDTETAEKHSDQHKWRPTACILCSINCGLEMQVDQGRIVKVRGDKLAPNSEGYICQKAAKLDHYQNHSARLRQPLKRQPNGEYAPVSWDAAIAEITARMRDIKAQHGGGAFAYYGGGGQGNHLGGSYSGALRAALDTPYLYTALAQEKTGDFWVNGKLFGRESCFVLEGMEHSDYCIVLGANPYMAHGVRKTRDLLKAYKKDPNRTLVVVDPRVSETAKDADIHLRVRPGMDAYLLAAIIAVIFQEALEDTEFLRQHTNGYDELRRHFIDLPVEQYATIAGVDPELARQVARGFATAKSATVRADLGIQHSLHSTLNSYLEKLLFLVTGNFNKQGGNHLMAQFAPLIGHSKTDDKKTAVTGMYGIAKLFPPNILPQEIDSDHPDRIRALVVDSANPALSAADTKAYRKAFDKLELMVVIDVAMTETARHAHYILPADSQFEKVESTYFTFGFPTNYYHLRRPTLPRSGDTLPEPEIYRRLLVGLGAIPDRFPLLERAAKLDRRLPVSRAFPLALAAALKRHPQWRKYVPVILYATLGKALPEGMQSAAAIWGVCQMYAAKFGSQVRRTGLHGKGYTLGLALFNRFLESPRPAPIATFKVEETWNLIKTRDRKINLYIPELTEWLDRLQTEALSEDRDYPFILAAGERRAYNANQIYRGPEWRKTDKEGLLRIHPSDLAKLGLVSGDKVRCRSRRGAVEAIASADESVLPGVLTLPHGFGMLYQDDQGRQLRNGPAINLLTDAQHCDPIAKTPYHKYVPVALEAVDV
ncbi:molybdopterin-dependent oxidoreductase [Hahella sp. NBU794]|uniref:molybdopterin-dependent oxidoreductase n=1 Tax=Hahella sp. NBU794 TaxID=3422590 RepID=UPI003D6F99D6